MNEPLLDIRNLTIRYREGGRMIAAVRDVSFELAPGGSLAIVGESGSGKSSIAGAILDFLGPEAEISGTHGLGDLPTDTQRRVERGKRILKHRPDAPPEHAPALRRRERGDVLTLELEAASSP
jgi:ABC-type glutathione transport system ATPase component